MACILKTPNQNSKGVVSITNIEYHKQIKPRADLRRSIEALKKDWVFCYHPNWAELNFVDTGVFDAVIGMREAFQFSEVENQQSLPLHINTSSNRMSPNLFHGEVNKKWDFVHVSRLQVSKNIVGFFNTVKEAFKTKPSLTGVLIISVKNDREMSAIRKKYDALFTREERAQFEFITLSYNLPFPLSKKVLAHFYAHSKVTLNTHLHEPHGRVIGYSLSCGMPVVGMKDLSLMVPEDCRREPFFYVTEDMNELPALLLKAIEYVDNDSSKDAFDEVIQMNSENYQSNYLQRELSNNFNLDDEGWNLYELGVRLSTHYMRDESTNTFDASIAELVDYLTSKSRDLGSLDEANIASQINHYKLFESPAKWFKDFYYCRLPTARMKFQDKILVRLLGANLAPKILSYPNKMMRKKHKKTAR